MYFDWWGYIYVASCWHTSVAMLICISDNSKGSNFALNRAVCFVQTSGSSDSMFGAFILDLNCGEVVLSLHRIISFRNRWINIFNKPHRFFFCIIIYDINCITWWKRRLFIFFSGFFFELFGIPMSFSFSIFLRH